MDRDEFFLSMTLVDRSSRFSWESIIVYGPTDHSRSVAFLGELEAKIDRCALPVMVAGDFNLIRSLTEKSSDHIDVSRMHAFNECIARLALREIVRVGG